MPQLARYRLRVVVLYVKMLSAVFNIYYKKVSHLLKYLSVVCFIVPQIDD